MENLTGGTPPVRPLPCVVPCKLYFTGVKGNAERARLVPAWYVLYREFAEENGEGTEAVMVLNAETGALMDPRIVSADNSTAE